MQSGAHCIAYETVTSATGGIPLLTPMSEVAGRLASQTGAHWLEKPAGGRGVLLAGVPGVPAAEVVILGAGVVGTHAATVARGMGANVIVAIDQGGCCETSQPTKHSDPTYVVDGIVHYCVTNMPGAVPRTSTFALNNATFPFVFAIADKGWREALRSNAHLRAGLNISAGKITYSPVGKAHGLPITPVEEVLGL